jgi:hypothetical protein
MNMELKIYAKRNNVFIWQVAQEMKISVATLHNWLRVEMSEEKTKMFIDAVDKLKGMR